MKKLALLSIFLALPLLGCTNWERDTFNTLSASDATINAAQAAYEQSVTAPCPAQSAVPCLPHTKAVYAAINQAKAGQTAAANAMVTYEEVKASTIGRIGLAADQNAVNVALAQLPTLIADIKALYPNGGQQ